ncbi:MAG TPA: hypothetical protein VGX68_01095 [Thermoanaerobaculia bacterium]|jgi:hypothetical protein|nr:hypothetical protein [Thermoanaerobaculia bacterium]
METQTDPRRTIFRRLTFYSVLGGLCPLIPVPFVDDWALGQVQRRMLSEVAQAAGVALSSRERKILAGGGESGWPGCFGSIAWAIREVVGALLGWLFRTVFYFLTIRRSARRSAETLHLGYLVNHALRLGSAALPPSLTSEDRARAIRAAAMKTLEQVDDKAIHRTLIRDFRRSLSLLLQAAALLRRFLPRRRKRRDADLAAESEVFHREEELLGGFVDRLSADLFGNQAYFAELERLFEGNLKVIGAPPPHAPAATER